MDAGRNIIMGKDTKSYERVFITGCDSNTEWMLQWFLQTFKKHNKNIPIFVCDFGLSETGRAACQYADGYFEIGDHSKRWFKKPAAMLSVCAIAEQICWLDTDCEVRQNIENIFDYTEPNKLAMVEDLPWTTRRKRKWYNSGVVAFQRTPEILKQWHQAIQTNKDAPGDQEVLHNVLNNDPLKIIVNITELPRKFNTLRLDLLDNTQPKQIAVMHWTGQKGKQHIRGLIENE